MIQEKLQGTTGAALIFAADAQVAYGVQGLGQVNGQYRTRPQFLDLVRGLVREAVLDGVLMTPGLAHSVLGGLTRDTIIRLAKERGIEVRETAIPRELLYLADELFFTGTAAEVTPIKSVDRITVGNGRRGPITETLQGAFFGLFSGKTPDKWGWLDHVEMARPRAVAAG